MKKISVVVLVASSLLIAGISEAAPKKRTRNANRIGPYAGALISQTTYSSDQGINEQAVINYIESQGVTFENVRTTSDDSDIGYEAVFGYRFHRYMAAELGLLQVGDRPRRVLEAVPGLRLVDLAGADQCCGFGGTFAVKNADTSVAMGLDKVAAIEGSGADVLTAADTSCLMHIGGLMSRRGSPVRVMHLAEILAASLPA